MRDRKKSVAALGTRREWIAGAAAIGAVASVGAASSAAAANSAAVGKQRYSFLVFSNPTKGSEETFIKWYEGQHVHDLLRIPGYVGARFYKLTDQQFGGEQPYRYLMIWEIETDDLATVFADTAARMKDGRTNISPAFDMAYSSVTMQPITKYVTAEEVRGRSIEETYKISLGQK